RTLLLVGALALMTVGPALALDAPSSAPKQSPAKFVKLFLKPSKEETAVDFGAFVMSGKVAWSLKTATYFGLWYFFNIFYNVANKKSLNALNMPWLQSLACVAVGIPRVTMHWAPKIKQASMALHAAGNVGGNMAFGAGALGFAHVLKSLEPAFTAVFSGLVTGKWAHPMVYATLIPVMGGVAYASASELSFNMVQFVSAMVSNVCFSLRGVLGKGVMSGKEFDRRITKLDGPNTFSVLQIGAAVMTVPFVAFFEGPKALMPWTHPNWRAAIGKLDHAGALITPNYLMTQLLVSGLAFQLYYEASYLALDAVSPVTHSLGNNLKRIIIVISSVVVFGQKMSTQSVIGSSIAIGGVIVYSQ
ncbi:triose-phosphate transporter family-domain-containing protein, partial [Baffinella frigidus]